MEVNMILDTIAEATRKRVEKAKKHIPMEELKAKIFAEEGRAGFGHREDFAFEKVLKKKEISFICEVKKASPSKGIIVKDFPYLTIAKEYEASGADAISVLTEPEYFKGSSRYLQEISAEVTIPVLRKDFIIDEYQIYEAKVIKADAVLLICSLLDTKQIKKYLSICDALGLSALVEAHTKEEINMALNSGARIIGVNNRNLQTFEVDIYNSINLRSLVPINISFVAESGIGSSKDIADLKAACVDAILIGEMLMKSTNKKEMIDALRCGKSCSLN
jgi:indole-3-glycerol phosphate synthase